MDSDNVQDAQVTLYEDTRDDLMAIAMLTRRDHRDVLHDAVEAIRERLVPKLTAPSAKGPKRGPKAAS